MARSRAVAFVFLTLVSATAAVSAAEWPLALPRLELPPTQKAWPAIATDGSDYLVVWISDGTLMARRVSADGVPHGVAPSIVASGVQREPAVAWDGRDYVIAWCDPATLTIRAARVDRDGTLIEQRQLAQYAPPPENIISNDDHTAVAANGNRILVAWYRYSEADVHAIVVDGELNVVVRGVHLRDVSSAVPQGGLHVSTDGRNFLVLWRAYAQNTSSVEGAIVDPNGGATRLSLGVHRGLNAVVFDGTNWLVAGADLVRITPAGAVSMLMSIPQPGQEMILLAMAPAPGGEIAFFWWTLDKEVVIQTIAADGKIVSTSTFAWQVWSFALSPDGGLLTSVAEVYSGIGNPADLDVQATRVRSDGSPGATRSIANGVSYQTRPAIDPDPQGWAAVWLEPRLRHPSKLYAARLSTDGTLKSGEGTQLSGGAVSPASMAFNGSTHLIVWWESTASTCRLLARRMSVSGELLDSAVTIYVQPGCGSDSAAVASDGRDWLVVWNVGGDFGGLRAARVSADGTLDLSYTTVTTNHVVDPATGGRSSSDGPVATFAGGVYWIAWTQRYGTVPPPLLQGDIYAARVTPAGRLVDPDGIAVAVDPDDQDSAAIASIGDGAAIVWVSGPVTSSMRSVRAAALSSSGQLLDQSAAANGRALSEPFLLEHDYYSRRDSLSIAGDGSAYNVIWASAGENLLQIHRATLDLRGNLATPDSVAVSAAGELSPVDALTRDSLQFAMGRWFVAYARIGLEPQYAGAPRVFLREIDNGPPRRRAAAR